MKYGWRERISGAVILIALAVILLPWLLSEPAPRSERPQPVLTIEQPIEVPRHEIAEPAPPASLGQLEAPRQAVEDDGEAQLSEVAEETAEQVTAEAPAPREAPEPAPDPIAELARAADQRLADRRDEGEEPAPSSSTPATPGGDWAVQVGSFGEPANAERLLGQLRDQGFPAYSQPRDNNLTTVFVGPFDSSEAGERAMNELKSQANLQGLLVRARN